MRDFNKILHAFPVLKDWISSHNFPEISETRAKKMKKTDHSWSKNSIFAVVWIKWKNIFRPAYFTLKHWKGMGKEPSGKKALDEAREGLMEWVGGGGFWPCSLFA